MKNAPKQIRDFEEQSKDERDAIWKDLEERSRKAYRPDVSITDTTLGQCGTAGMLMDRLDLITVRFAEIGSKRNYGRGRVYRSGTPIIELYDTGEIRKDTAQKRLQRFLVQQIQCEAARLAEEVG